MNLPQVVLMDESGEVAYEGGLREFIRANEYDAHDLIATIRADMTQSHGRPEPTIIGGGASPAFYLSLVE